MKVPISKTNFARQLADDSGLRARRGFQRLYDEYRVLRGVKSLDNFGFWVRQYRGPQAHAKFERAYQDQIKELVAT